MNKIDNNIFPFHTFRLFSAHPELLHFVSSGTGNIGFTENADPGEILANRRALAGAVGFAPELLTLAHQVHSAKVAVVGAQERGRGAFDNAGRLADTDALVTDEAGICLLVMSADCVPVLLYDPCKRVIAAVHAGWRGTVGGIVSAAVQRMVGDYGCCPGHIIAGIGPSIGVCCFEVGEEVAAVFSERYPLHANIVSAAQEGKKRINLWEANRFELLSAGVAEAHIEVAGMCTCCGNERFFSYRREGKAAGRFGAGIMLKMPR